jgi:pimeloyl-ACP methyl ester carboxylesterase
VSTSLSDPNPQATAEPLFALPFPEVQDSFTTSDGVVIQTYDWGGDGPPLLFAHATGLHAHVWVPLAQRLRSNFHCYAIDARAQGDSTAPPGAQALIQQSTEPTKPDTSSGLRPGSSSGASSGPGSHSSADSVADSVSDSDSGSGSCSNPSDDSVKAKSGFAWDNITSEYATAMDIWGLSGRGDVFGLGHSQGGFALLSAALARPGTFAQVFGFEPVIFPAPVNAVEGHPMDNHMATIARKRREVFGSKQEAFENYRGKLPFKMADDDVTRSYVHWGFDELADGTVRLKCRAAWEGELFSLAMSDLYHRLPGVDCKVTLGLAEFTTPNFTDSIPLQHAQMPNSTVMHFPGRSHFGPLENTDEMATILRRTFLGL